MKSTEQELIQTQKDYIKLLSDNMNGHVGYLIAHNIKPCTDEEYEKGKEFREKIEQLEKELNPKPQYYDFKD